MIRGFSILFFVLCAVFTIGPGALMAESSNTQKASSLISAQAEAEKASLTIGEPVVVKVVVTLESSLELINGIPDPTAHGLTLKEHKTWQDREGKKVVFGRSWTVTGFQLGRFMIEPIEVAYRAKGGEVQTVKTNPVYITIESIAAGEKKTDIRDVKGVVTLQSQIMKYLLPVGVPLSLLLLLALYLIYFRKKDLLRAQSRVVLSPAEEALTHLRTLFDSTLIRDGKIKNYYFTFSEILKIYLEKQFGIQAIEGTTSEIAAMLKRVPATDESKKKLVEVLEAADFAKFAKWIPPPADIVALNKKAETVVTELLIRPDAAKGNGHAVS